MEDKIIFSWNKDIQANGYIIKQEVKGESIELVRVENIDLTTIVISDIKEGVQNHFIVSFYKKENGDYCIYREEDFYCFLSPKGQNIYKFPIPKLKKVTKIDTNVVIEWEKVSNGITYAVFRKLPRGKWIRIGMTQNNCYEDSEISDSKKYIYTVKCVSDDGKINLSSCNYKGISV